MNQTLRNKSNASYQRFPYKFVPPVAKQKPCNGLVLTLLAANYCLISIAIVYLNHHVFTKIYPYPLHVSWLQQIVSLAVFAALSYVGKAAHYTTLENLFKIDFFSTESLLKTFPLGIAFVMMIGAANEALKHGNVSTYVVARSLSTLATMIMSVIVLKRRETLLRGLACALVTLGYLLGALGHSSITKISLFYGMCSSMAQAVYSVLVIRAVNGLNKSSHQVLLHNLVWSIILFPIAIVCVPEIPLPSPPYDLGATPGPATLGFFVFISGKVLFFS